VILFGSRGDRVPIAGAPDHRGSRSCRSSASPQTVQAKLDPMGTYLLYRISGNGRDRYEPRKVTDVESGVTTPTEGPGRSHSPRRELRRWGGLPPSRNIAGAPGKVVARHNEPTDAGRTGSGIWEPEGIAMVTDGVIKLWYGIVHGDREYLIFRRMEPDQMKLTLTIEQHARELLDLLADEDPHDDPPERRLLLGAVLALIEERHEHWSA
jgi:hypothetical protein